MSRPKPVLRAFAESDFPAIADLWVEAWKATGFPVDFEARRGWFADHLRALRASGSIVMVGLDAELRPAGFAAIDSKDGCLDQLCVAPAERGSGLAIALLDEAKRRSPGAVKLEVNEANARARRFYEREGFLVAGYGRNAASGLPTLKLSWRAEG